jgi:hypothetical protein
MEDKELHAETTERLPYVKPELVDHGSVAEMTAAGGIDGPQDGELSYAPDETDNLS